MSPHRISDTIERALRSAGLDTGRGPAKSVSETIRRALAAAGLAKAEVARSGDDLELVERLDSAEAAPVAEKRPTEKQTDKPRPEGPPASAFLSRKHAGPVGVRKYKLYVPAAAPDTALPLIVMLHGCKQNPDDFAAGTQMNMLADQHGFLVAYPAQSKNANGSNCWNWFRPQDQQREGGEPEILAGIVADVMHLHRVDPKRVFVAGLSAGAAMAVILGHTHPEVFAAVGAHSGLAFGAAHDVGSAFMAMNGGHLFFGNTEGAQAPARGAAPRTIVFHGDDDSTVALRNAEAIVQQAVSANQAAGPLEKKTYARRVAKGLEVTRTVYADPAGHARVEQWLLHGGTHAWSGGSAAGSYTDAHGPDASAEMVRFFLARS